VPGLYGASGEPVFVDLVDGELAHFWFTALILQPTNLPPTPITMVCSPAYDYSAWADLVVDLDLYTNILLGFVKCKPAWVQSWFPYPVDYDKLSNRSPATRETAFMLKYDQEDGKRHAVAIAETWVSWNYLGFGDERGPAWTGAW